MLSLTGISCLAYDSATNTLWAGSTSSNRVLVIACDSNRVVASVCLPDGWYPEVMCANWNSSSVFCLRYGSGNMVVLDCASQSVAADIPLRASTTNRAFHNRQHNKVYCVRSDGHGVFVIDGATNVILDTIVIDGNYPGFCLDTRRGWVYRPVRLGGKVYIFDGSADTVIGERGVAGMPWPVCYSSVSDRVYVGAGDPQRVHVLDSTSVVAQIPVVEGGTEMCYNPVRNKVYTVGGGPMSVINCETNSVEATINGVGGYGSLLYDSLEDCVFCAGYGRITGINGYLSIVRYRADISGIGPENLVLGNRGRMLYIPRTISANGGYQVGVQAVNPVNAALPAFIPVRGNERPRTTCWSSVQNKVYVACQGAPPRVFVLDGATNQPLGSIPVGGATGLAYSAAYDRVFCADSVWCDVHVIDCARDSVIATIPVQAGPVSLLALPDGSKVYCANRASNSVSVIDVAQSRVVQTLALGASPIGFAYSTGSDKVYCVTSNRVMAIRRSDDELVASVVVPDHASGLAYSPLQDRVYCVSGRGSGNGVTAIQCANDSVRAFVSVSSAGGIGYNSDLDYVYCGRWRAGGGRQEYYLGFERISCADNRSVGGVDVGWGICPDASAKCEFHYDSYTRRMFMNFNGSLKVYSGTSQAYSCGPVGFGGGFGWNRRENRVYIPCQNESRVAVIRSPGGAVEEPQHPDAVREWLPMPTVVRGRLTLVPTVGSADAENRLLDVSGCVVRSLAPGENDVSRLSPGVYFITTVGGSGPASCRKVILTR